MRVADSALISSHRSHAAPDSAQPGHYVTKNAGYFRIPLDRAEPPCDSPESEGSCTWAGSNWYDVPFGVMVPKTGQASNLLLPVAISASSVAYSSARIENMFMDLGSAAGVAVSLLLDKQSHSGSGRGNCPSLPVQSTNISAVQHVLLSK